MVTRDEGGWDEPSMLLPRQNCWQGKVKRWGAAHDDAGKKGRRKKEGDYHAKAR